MTVIAGSRVVTPAGVLNRGWVRVEGDRITHVGAGEAELPPTVEVDGWIVPGFVDTHVHGGGGASFDGLAAALDVVAFHRRHGTTSIIASLMTAPLDVLARSIAELAELVSDGTLAGLHLEGPFLDAGHRGAHAESLLRSPVPGDVKRLLEAGRGTVRMVTLAPELPGGLEAVRLVVDAEAVAAVGHTGGSYEVTCAAIDAGARVATHLFNGMPQPHHREPGPVVALLEDERVVVEMIYDGHHVHPSVVRLVMSTAGPRRVSLVSDATAAAGSRGGCFRLGSVDIVVREGVASVADGTSLAGSTLTLSRSFQRTAVDFGVEAAVAMAASTPARAHGLRDVGELSPGRVADLVLLDEGFGVTAVMCRGAWVGGASP